MLEFSGFKEIANKETGISKLTKDVDITQINIIQMDRPLFVNNVSVETTYNNVETVSKVDNSDSINYKPNTIFNENYHKYETDENGVVYKQDGKLLPNIQYAVKENIYFTDKNGRIVKCEGNPVYTEEGNRNIKEQGKAGGEDRKKNDDGGHLIAKILGGAEGIENLVAMRATINRGDYKAMENEISKAVQEGKEVKMNINLEYNSYSDRPSEICVEYTIDGDKTINTFDNIENSEELLNVLENKITGEDFENLKEEIADMKEDGAEVSVTSSKTVFDENDNASKIIITILDENTHLKTKITFDATMEGE